MNVLVFAKSKVTTDATIVIKTTEVANSCDLLGFNFLRIKDYYR